MLSQSYIVIGFKCQERAAWALLLESPGVFSATLLSSLS